MTTVRPPVAVAIVGSTASGKSALAMALAAEAADLQIVAVDAMQVYRGMDIGTAKPSRADRAAVVHHTIDLVAPSCAFSVTDYVAAFDAAMATIAAAGARAVLVAGTGLYLRAALDCLEPPGQWPEVRATLVAELVEIGPAGLHARLASLDPKAARRMEPSNDRRVVRALEVCIGSGRPFSSFGPGLDVYPALEVPQVGLRWPRAALAGRVEARVHQMMAAGLLAEVARLLEAPGGLSYTAAQALGYKELAAHVRGTCSLDEAVETMIVRTRQYAVRQERWFRRDPRITWLDTVADPLEALAAVKEVLNP